MTYTTTVSVHPHADRGRVRALVVALRRLDCVVRVDVRGHALVCEFPADDYQWIVTGGFGRTLRAFEDCVQWRSHFRERPPEPLPRLPR